MSETSDQRAAAAATRPGPAHGTSLADGSIVRLARPIAELAKRHAGMSPQEAFVLSRLAAGRMTVAELAKVCPQPRAVVIEILERCITGGFVAIG